MNTQATIMEKSSIADRDYSTRAILSRVFFYVVLILITLVVLMPVLWLVLASLRLEENWQRYPIVIFPRIPQFINYITAMDAQYKFFKLAGNTLKIALPSTVFTVCSSAMSGYAFARLKAPGKKLLFILVLSMLMVPRMVTQIPNFILFSRLGLTDTYWPWYLWGLSGASWNIFLFRQFFATISKDLEDAATVDGCSWFRTFWQIFLPLSGPVIATVAIFHFQWVWGDWFTPQIFLSAEKTTLGVAVGRYYVTPRGMAIQTLQTAATVLYLTPMLIIFLFMQKYIVQGIATTGLKG
ncbi:MAG: carbohydrate ABC transporter permease [Anaerolineae bacterium]|nr:carbohydrate ABC transporter permease [Anaerolineae bacterium]